MTDEQELATILAKSDSGTEYPEYPMIPPSPTANANPAIRGDLSQWSMNPNDEFRPASRSTSELPAGIYNIGQDQFGVFLRKKVHLMDDIVELPDAAHKRVLTGIQRFWRSKDLYTKHGLVYKRGVLLWGPPGSGKTVTIGLLIRELIEQHNGVVLVGYVPSVMSILLPQLRRIEPTRPLIVVWEDIDEIIDMQGEHALLAVLDGEEQVDNVVHVATTNYPDRLGARIVNRPSRFDERIKIGMPSGAARMMYLKKVVRDAEVPIQQWCEDTEGLSIAHLRELAVAVICLGQDYRETVERLRAMAVKPKFVEDGFRREKLGLG